MTASPKNAVVHLKADAGLARVAVGEVLVNHIVGVDGDVGDAIGPANIFACGRIFGSSTCMPAAI